MKLFQVVPLISPDSVIFPQDPALNKLKEATLSNVYSYSGIKYGQHGIWISTDVSTEYLDGTKVEVVAYFYLTAYGYSDQVLKDFNGQYSSQDGQVSVSNSYSSANKFGFMDNLQMFIPYRELHLARGTHGLKIIFNIFSDGNLVAISDQSLVGTVYNW
ncbi:MAG: hypothetical protein R3B93_09200 [Bacteroidia bacterium]